MAIIYPLPQRRKLTLRGFIWYSVLVVLLLTMVLGAVYALSAFLPWIDNRRPVETERIWHGLGILFFVGQVLGIFCLFWPARRESRKG